MSQFYLPIEERVVLRPDHDEVIVSLYVPNTIKHYYLALSVGRNPLYRYMGGMMRSRSWLVENKLAPLPTIAIDLLLDDSRTVPSGGINCTGGNSGDPRGLPRDELYPRASPRADSGYLQLFGGNDSNDSNELVVEEGLWFELHKPPEQPKIYPADYIECMLGESRVTLVRNQPIKLLKDGFLNILQCSAGRITTTDDVTLQHLDIQTNKLNLFSERDQSWERKQAESAILFGVAKISSLGHLTPLAEGDYEILHIPETPRTESAIPD